MAWIVITGSLIDTTKGGGFEFIGPFSTEEAAIEHRDAAKVYLSEKGLEFDRVCLAVELLKPRV